MLLQIDGIKSFGLLFNSLFNLFKLEEQFLVLFLDSHEIRTKASKAADKILFNAFKSGIFMQYFWYVDAMFILVVLE